MLTTKKILTVIKTILKVRDPGDEIENEVTSSEIFFSPASCKVASFPLILNLMYQCSVISFLYEEIVVLWCTSTYLAKNFKGTGLATVFYPIEPVKITKN